VRTLKRVLGLAAAGPLEDAIYDADVMARNSCSEFAEVQAGTRKDLDLKSGDCREVSRIERATGLALPRPS
jgi:hypothetical protein